MEESSELFCFSEIAMFRGTIMYELAITKAALFSCLLDEDMKEGPGLRTLAQVNYQSKLIHSVEE